jgi:hypothetical protein
VTSTQRLQNLIGEAQLWLNGSSTDERLITSLRWALPALGEAVVLMAQRDEGKGTVPDVR